MTLQSPRKLTLPKVIFLDAMGTLFGIKSSVGEIYQEIALKYGVKGDANHINAAFINSFKTAPPLAFQSRDVDLAISQQEFIWWQKVVTETFCQAGILDNFSDFSSFFAELYMHFSTEKPWYIYPDVIPRLQNWQQQGIQLGVISNFDSRLNQVLKVLNLSNFFTTITISSLAGFAKPDSNIFKIALAKHNFTAQQAWHIGDSFVADYQGAKKVGIQSFWLNRSRLSTKNENHLPNLSSLG
jgi:putative hydrolase of the HAD superfamily